MLTQALRALLQEGRTLALPTFTFHFLRAGEYVWTTASETGVLSEAARQLLEFERTENPVYSFAVAGPASSEIKPDQNTEVFGAGSIFDKFDTCSARILLVGCGLRSCTQFHRYEADAKVPYRLMKRFEGTADYGSGPVAAAVDMFARDLEVDAQNDFTKVEEMLTRSGALTRTQLWGGEIIGIDCAALRRATMSLLGADPYVLTTPARQVEAKVRNRLDREVQPPVKVAVCGHATLEGFVEQLRTELDTFIEDRRVETFRPEYGQLIGDIRNPGSALHSFDAGVSLFVDFAEDLIGEARFYPEDAERLEDAVLRYCEALAAYRKARRGWMVVSEFPNTSRDELVGDRARTLLGGLNDTLRRTVADLEECLLVSPETIAATTGVKMRDDRLWVLGRLPFSSEFAQAYSRRMAGYVLAAQGLTVRIVAVDLDNTLWGGILGDDGIEGLAIGGDYPGNAFRSFQRRLKSLSERGMAIAILSKNDEKYARAAIETRPEMVLGLSDIVAYRINWDPKWRNLQDILEELSLGPRSALFIDDNPTEREQMRLQMPDVHVLELPDDPAEFVAAIEGCPLLATLALTGEDVKRTESYRARSRLMAVRSTAKDENDFYRQLRPVVTLKPLNEGNAMRISQLVQKTNQFNTTTIRPSRQELQTLHVGDGQVLAVGVEDTFNPYEILGVLILRHTAEETVVESFVLSCRVLGRGVEPVIVAWVVRQALARGAARVTGDILETPRNTPCRDIFQRSGFQRLENRNRWEYTESMGEPEIPDWITVRAPAAVSKSPQKGDR